MFSALLLVASVAGLLQAQAVRTGFSVAGTQARNDDVFTGPFPIGFAINFFGTTYTSLYVGTNGYVTFDRGQTGYDPQNLINYQQKIIAPFYSDIDTRNTLSGQITWGSGSVNGRQAFVVTWNSVGYFSSRADKTNTLQLVLINRSDRATNDFDFEFNYNQIQWEAGNLNGGTNGLCSTGCEPPTVGYSNGLAGTANRSFEQRGSHVAGAFLDSNSATGLRHQQSGGSGVNGRLLFTVSNGAVSGGGTGTGGTGTGGSGGTGFCSSTGGTPSGGVTLIDGPVCTGLPSTLPACPLARPGPVTAYGANDPLVLVWLGLTGLTQQSTVRARFSFNGVEQPSLDYGPFSSFQAGSNYLLCPSFVPNASSIGPWTMSVYVNSSATPFITVSFTIGTTGGGTGGGIAPVPSNSTSFGATCAGSFPGTWNTSNVGTMGINPVRTDGLLTGGMGSGGGVIGNGFVIGRVLTAVTNGDNGFVRWLMAPSGSTMVGLPNAFFGPGSASKLLTNPPSPVVPCLGTGTAALWVGQWDTVPFGTIRARMNLSGSVTFTVPQNCDFPGGTFTGTASGLGLTGTFLGPASSGTFSLAFPANDVGNFSGSYSVGSGPPQPWTGKNRSNGLINDFSSDRGFTGRWYTPYGLLTLKVAGGTATGTYPNGGTITGTVSPGNLGPPDFGGGVTLTGSYSDLSGSGAIFLRINGSIPNDPYPQAPSAYFHGHSTNTSGFTAPWVGARAGDWSGTWSTQLGTMTGSQRADGKWVFKVGGYTFVGNATNPPAGGGHVSGQFIGPFGGGGFVFSLNQDGVSFSGSVAAWSHLGLYATLQATHVSDTIGPIDLCSTIRPVTTITTVPSGLQVRVDLATLTAPVTRNYPSGEGHGFSTPSPQTLNGVSYNFSLWNYTLNAGGGILAPPSSATYTAVFTNGTAGAGPGGFGGIWTSPNGPIRIIPTGGNTVEGLYPAGGPGGFSGFTCTVNGNTCTGTAFTPNGPPGTITITVSGPSLTGTITRPGGGGGTIPVSGTVTGPSGEPVGPRVTFSPAMTTVHQGFCNASLPDPTKVAFFTNDPNITHWVGVAGITPGDVIGVTYTGPGGVRYFGQTPTQWSSIWACYTLPVSPTTAPLGNWTVSLSVNNQVVAGTTIQFTLSAPPPGGTGGGGTGGGGTGATGCPSTTNISRFKPTEISSGTGKELGNNDIINEPNFWGFHTVQEAGPWWQVDLGTLSTICEVRLYNRVDGEFARAATVRVLLSTDNVNFQTAYAHDGTVWGVGGLPPLVITEPVASRQARYVRIQLPGTGTLHLREVQVFGVAASSGGGGSGGGGTGGGGTGGGSGTPATGPGPELPPGTAGGGTGGGGTGTGGTGTGGGTCPSTNNIALNRPAIQSTDGFGGTAARGNNGLKDGADADFGIHTGNDPQNPGIAELNPFWRVDFGSASTLCEIRLFNRPGQEERARTVQVRISDDDVNYTTVYQHPGTTWGTGGSTLVVNLAGRTARYLRVQLNERTYLNLREVEVYGYIGTGGGGTGAGGTGGFGLLRNGSFEEPIIDSPFLTLLSPSTVEPGWVVNSGSVDLVKTYFKASDGTQAIDLNGNGPGSIRQSFATVPGTQYTASFDLAGNAASGPQLKRFRVSAAGLVSERSFDITGRTVTDVTGMGWRRESFTFRAESSTTVLEFAAFMTEGSFGAAIDNVCVVEGTAACGGAGSGGAGGSGGTGGGGTGGTGGTGTDPCSTLSLNPTGQPIGAPGGTFTFAVASTCSWTATSNDTWIQITAGQNGNGNGSVNYFAAVNSGQPRSGTITVGGKTFSVFQNGTPSGTSQGCSYPLQSVNTQSFNQDGTNKAGGTTGLVRFLTNQTCAWTVTVVYPPGMGSGWITAEPLAGSGNGAVSFTVARNSGNARQGALLIAGQNVAILQDGVPPAPPVGTPAIATGGVVNAASYAPGGPPNGLAQGSFFSIFGTSLGPAEPATGGYPLPTNLGGVTVQILSGGNTYNAYLVFVSAGQINGLLPSNVPPGAAQMTVALNGRTSAQAAIQISRASFGAFFQVVGGNNVAIAQNVASATDYPLNLPSLPAKPGQIVILWGTGLGPLNGPDNVAPGANGGDLRGPPVNLAVAITVGGQSLPAQNILYAGRQAESAGVDNIYFTLPANVALGCNVPVTISVGGVTANTTTIAISADGSPCR